MDREKLSSACAAIEAFFTAEERAIMKRSDWRHNGQTFYERVEGYVLGLIETLEDEIENPDPPDEDQTGPTDDIHSSDEDWWWLAVNGPSCAACGFPAQLERLKVRPVSEQMIGFRTREEQVEQRGAIISAILSGSQQEDRETIEEKRRLAVEMTQLAQELFPQDCVRLMRQAQMAISAIDGLDRP